MNKAISLILSLLISTPALAIKVGVIDDFTSYHGNEVVKIIKDNSPKNIEVVMYQLNKGSSQEDYLAILDQVSKSNLDVLNLSFGTKEYDSKEHSLLRKISNTGTKIVVAAGNSNVDVSKKDPVYPCLLKLDNLYCIGALDQDKKSQFSNYGRNVDFFIDGTFSKGNMTSFAAPRFAAVLAHLITGNLNIDSYLESSFKLVMIKNGEILRAVKIDAIKEEMKYQQKALLVSKRHNPI